MVEDLAAACPQAQWLAIHSAASSVAKLLRLAFQAQSDSVRQFDRRFGSHPLITVALTVNRMVLKNSLCQSENSLSIIPNCSACLKSESFGERKGFSRITISKRT